MIRKLLLVFGGIVLLLAAGPLMAAPDPANEKAAEESAEDGASKPTPKAETQYVEVNVSGLPSSNTIATKLPLSIQMTPANVGTVSEVLVTEQAGYYLSDALRNVSSLNIQAQGGVTDFFMIRGYDSVSSSLILTDGAAEPEATWYPMYNVAAVEVLKGPSGFLYGIDPLAGVVNIVRKQPVPTSFANLGLTGGSFGTVEGTVDWNQASEDGRHNFRLNGMAFQTDNYREVGTSRQWALNPSFAWELRNGDRLNFNMEYVDAEFRPDSGIPLVDGQLPDVPRERSYQTPFDFSDQTIGRFQLDYEKKIGERVRIRNKFYYRALDWETLGTQFLGTFPTQTGSTAVSRLQTGLDDRQRFTGNQLEGVFEASTGSVKHNVLVGVELKYLRDDFDIGIGGVPTIDLYDPVETAQPIDPFPFLGGKSESFVVAPYVTDQIAFSPKFELLLGARYDMISRDDQRQQTNPPTLEDISRDDTKVSPMVGFVFAPDTSLSLYANAAQSYAPAGVRVFGDLDPEESAGFEVGIKKRFLGDKVRTTFAAYQLDRENLPIPDDTGVIQQAGDQRSRGLEVEFAAEVAPRLRAFLSYAYTDAELTSFTEQIIVGVDPGTQTPIYATVDRSGNTPAFVPKNLLNLWLSKSFRGGLGIGGGARYIGEQFIAEDNVATIDSAVVLDATVFYDFKSARVSVNFKNLTDTEYELRGFGSASVIPAAPRSVFFGLQYRL
jgi:TonB-dependent siderophore receptor